MTLRDEIHANPLCAEALERRDCAELARIISQGRTRDSGVEIGDGSILEAFGPEGLEQANTFIDYLRSDPAFRHVVRLLDRGALRIGKPMVQTMVQSLVPAGKLTQQVADTLCAMGKEPAPVTAYDVAFALYYPDGSLK